MNRGKKHLAAAMILLLVFLLIGCGGSKSHKASWQGDGTRENPYCIANAEELMQMADSVNTNRKEYADAHFILTEDIDLSGREWIPAGYSHPNFEIPGRPFLGSFDGLGHKVSNMMISLSLENMRREDGSPISFGQGFFGCIGENAEVKNLTLENADVSYLGKMDAGEITIGCLVGTNLGGTISDCQVSGTVSLVGSKKEVGGIVGDNRGNVISCAAVCTIADVRGAEPMDSYIGGIAGINYETIESSAFHGSITSDTPDYSKNIGGLVGRNEGQIKNSHGDASIEVSSGRSSLVGGAAGYNQGILDNCTSLGTLVAKDFPLAVGGLVGANSLADEERGGIISNCKTAVAVQVLNNSESENVPVGCFIGSTDKAAENCLCNSSLSVIKDFVGTGSDEGIVESAWNEI